MPAARLLTLSPERIERERRFAELAAQQARDERRRARSAAVVATAWLMAGYCLLGVSLWVKDPDAGAIAFWTALVIGNFGPVATGFRFWGYAET